MAQSRFAFNRSGCVLLLIGLLLLVGTISYVAAGLLGARLPGFDTTQPPVTTMTINSSFSYAGVDLAVVNAQQSKSFLDDPNTSTDGMLRVAIQAADKTPVSVSWNYANIAQLVLPGKTIIKPAYVNAPLALAPGKTNGQMLYFGLNWTLKSATTSLSIPGQQAARDMHYVILTLSVNNTLSQVAITGSPYDYARLQFGNTTVSPKDSTLPVSFKTGVSGDTGTLSFLIPQKNTAFTLILLPQSQNSTEQATTDFQLM